jgi:hypothetical protein
MAFPGRSHDCATSAELGHGLAPEYAEPAPTKCRHELETITEHDGPPVVRCEHCGASGSVGSIDPFAECPSRGEDSPDAEPETIPAP